MPYRIFDSILGSHSWDENSQLRIAQPTRPGDFVSFEDASLEIEIAALFSRLLNRSKLDRTIYRAATRLYANPSVPLNRLAADLGVTERYLLSGLGAALSVDPHAFLQKAKAR
jgi:hypothetical protein